MVCYKLIITVPFTGIHLSKSASELNPTAAGNTQSRTNFATMHIQSLTHDRLAAALRESREKYVNPVEEKVYGSSKGARVILCVTWMCKKGLMDMCCGGDSFGTIT